MAPTATGSKARWAPQARRKACMGLELGRSVRRTGAGAYCAASPIDCLTYETELENSI